MFVFIVVQTKRLLRQFRVSVLAIKLVRRSINIRPGRQLPLVLHRPTHPTAAAAAAASAAAAAASAAAAAAAA